MRFKLILRRSETLPPPPLLGHAVLMAVVLLLTHTMQTHALSSSLQWLTCGNKQSGGKMHSKIGSKKRSNANKAMCARPSVQYVLVMCCGGSKL